MPSRSPRKKRGINCSSACITKDHYTFGECMRAKGLQVAPNIMGLQANKDGESELQAYRDARAQGIKPAGTRRHQIDEAVRISQETGKAYESW